MPTISALQIPPPANWQDFEILCCDLWRLIWNYPNTQRNGRQGQPQNGVDIYGRPDNGDCWAGIQCKGKDNYSNRTLTETELKEEVEKAKSFKPRLSEFNLVTTGVRVVKVQELARKITDEHRKKGLFPVHVWFWEDIVNRMADFPSVIEKHYPKEIIEIKEQKPTKPLIFIPHPYPEAPNFTGRKKEQEMLTNWLTEDKEHPLLSMVAIGGMGKSALAWRWLQEGVIGEGLELDGVVWWSFYETAANFSSFINETITNLFPEKEEDWRKRADREKIDLVYQELANHRFLIVFDGFERTLRAYSKMSACYQGDECPMDEQSRQCIDPNLGSFLSDLTSKNCKSKTLLTTRLNPLDIAGAPGVKNFPLKHMNPEDAVEFFHRQGVKGSPPEIRRYCEKYDYLSLCLRLLSGVIITHPKFRKAKDIKHAEEIPDLKLTKVDDEYHRDALKFEHILQYSFDELREANQLLISNIAAFRSPMEFSALREILAQNTDVDELREQLECFKKRGLLLYNEENDTYDLHPVVRRYCYAKLTAPTKTHEKIAEYLESLVGPETTKVEKIDDLQPVIELYHHTVGAGRYDEAYSLFYERFGKALHYQFGNYHLEIETLSALLPKEIDDKPLLNESNHAFVSNQLANSYSFSGQPRRAVPLFQRNADYDEKLDRKEHLVIGLGNLVGDQLKIGDLDSAESNLRRKLKIHEEVKNAMEEGYAHTNLGLIHSFRSEFDIANNDFENGEKKYNEISLTQGVGYNWAYRSLRALLADDQKEALKCANKALEFAKKTEKEIMRVPRDFIRANWLIGASYVAMKDIDKAEETLQFAITECRKINMVDHEAQILLSIAKLRFLQDKKDESLKLATEALETANRCGYVLQQADIHLFLAEFYRDQGDIPKAKEQAELAKLRSHQMIDVDSGDYITKDEDTKWKYKPCYDKAIKFLDDLYG